MRAAPGRVDPELPSAWVRHRFPLPNPPSPPTQGYHLPKPTYTYPQCIAALRVLPTHACARNPWITGSLSHERGSAENFSMPEKTFCFKYFLCAMKKKFHFLPGKMFLAKSFLLTNTVNQRSIGSSHWKHPASPECCSPLVVHSSIAQVLQYHPVPPRYSSGQPPLGSRPRAALGSWAQAPGRRITKRFAKGFL